jgi:hypothetical protein
VTRAGAAAPAPPRRRGLIAAAGLVLAWALALVVWMQAHQFRLLNETNQYQDDYVQVSLAQLEMEFLRLRLQWQQALRETPPDRDALRLRYDIFVSRVNLLESPPARRLLSDSAEYDTVLGRARRFVADADVLLGEHVAGVVDPSALAARLPVLEALGAPIHALVLDGAHGVAQKMALRNAAVRETNRNTIMLTALLALATFGFAILAMTQLRRLEQRRRALETLTVELARAQQAAEAASVAKSTFLANMSHEIRTPLQGVLGMLALLADSPLDESQRQRLRTAGDSADHLLAILNDILDIAKLEAGKLTIQRHPVDVRALVGDIEALMRAQALAKGLALSVTVAHDVPGWIEADSTRARQILLNLASNAIKFTQRGSVTLRVARAGSRLRFGVEDTGIGIDEQTQQRLFKRFGRGDDSRARRHGGTGLGLEISRELARLMGGDIEVTSTPGTGSTFVLDLPLVETRAPAADAALPGAVPPPPAAGKLVLVADDNAVNREYTGAVIERLGHRVVLASDGAQAVAVMRSQPVDLVLMDLHMPGVDGLEATQMIRALDGAAARVPVIALTADAFAETRSGCLDAGMDGFVAKPASPEDLAAVMRQHLGGARAARAGADAARAGARAAPPPEGVELVDAHVVGDVLRSLSTERIESLADRFVADTQAAIGQMDAALRAGDRQGLRQRAHACKGAAAVLGMKALAAIAGRLQDAAQQGDSVQAAAQLREMERLIAPSRAALGRAAAELSAT